MIQYPDISPVIFHAGPFVVRWYGVAYLIGFFAWYLYISRKSRRKRLGLEAEGRIDTLITYAILGVILGGRIGYILIYNLPYYLAHPLSMLAIWQGGMSFHGGATGLIIAGLLFCKKYGISFYKLADETVAIAPVGLFFGRIANFINDELYGRVSNLPWAMVFPDGGPLPRHPSELYEAFLEGIVLLIIMQFSKRSLLAKEGKLMWLFILLYGAFRFLVEFTRQPDPQLGFIIAGLSMGQLLSIPMIVAGGYFFVRKST